VSQNLRGSPASRLETTATKQHRVTYSNAFLNPGLLVFGSISPIIQVIAK
jgi:hypothetical protein